MPMNLSEISTFNDQAFPVRKPHSRYDKFRLLDNPFVKNTEDIVYQEYSGENYVAQMITMPAPLIKNNTEIPAFWGQDYFVKEDYRGKGLGKNLAPKYLGQNYYIAVGFSPKSEIIHRKMGARPVGYLDSFQKWISPVRHLTFYFHRLLKWKTKALTEYSFPDKIHVDGRKFSRVRDAENICLPEKQWNCECMESLRNKSYLKWRFFYRPDRYFVYQSEREKHENPDYIVLKPHFYKGVNWLLVSDFRFKLNRKEDFASLIRLAEKICRELGLYGVCIATTLKDCCDTLLRTGYTRTAHKVILTTYPFTHPEQESEDEMTENIFLTLADSDLDMHDNRGKFNFD